MKLISFDIDGTMTFGVPPGRITVDIVRKAKALGYIVGSASDRTISDQTALWKAHGVEVDFVSLKHRLDEVKQRFPVQEYVHIGDSDGDRFLAGQAGFKFYWVHDVAFDNGWLP